MWRALQAFLFGFRARKERGTDFSVLAAREMKLVPRSLLRNRTETLTTQAKLNAWPIESERNVTNRLTVYLYLHL